MSSLEVSAEIDELRLQIDRPATLPAARPAEPTDFTAVGGGGGGAPSAAGGGEASVLATLCLGGLTFRANGTPFSETRHLQIAVASVALDDARERTHPAVARLATVVASLPPWPPPPAATPARGNSGRNWAPNFLSPGEGLLSPAPPVSARMLRRRRSSSGRDASGGGGGGGGVGGGDADRADGGATRRDVPEAAPRGARRHANGSP